MDKNDIVMVSAARTPFGRYGGSLKDFDYFDLGAIPMREVLRESILTRRSSKKFSGGWETPLRVKMFIPLWRQDKLC